MKTLNEYRKRMLEQAFALGYSHMASALSALPIIVEIFKNFDLKKDVFVLSKGHGAYALYAVLEDLGYSPRWQDHEPKIDPANGVTCTTGSLGHGLPVAAGIAFAKQLKNEPGTVHVLLGDGECAEGTTWESLLFIDKFRVDNLAVHIDCNSYQAISQTIYPAPLHLAMAFQHIYPAPLHLAMAFQHIYRHVYMKGFGIKFFESQPWMHVHPIIKDEYEKMMEELA